MNELTRKLSVEVEKLKKEVEDLSSKNDLLNNLFEHVLMGITVWDKEGRLLYANRGFSTLTGYSKVDIQDLNDWFPKAYPDVEYREKVLASWVSSAQLQNAVKEFNVTCKDHKVKRIEFRATFLTNGWALVTLTDITIMHQTRAELQKQTDRYQALSNSAFEAMFVSVGGRCVDANKAAEKMFGYSREKLIGMFGTDIFAIESKELVKKNVLSDSSLPYEAIAQRKDGSQFHVEIRGQMTEHEGQRVRITAINDIDQRKRAEKELQESERILKSIFTSAPVGIGMVVDRVITKANERLCEITGYLPEELLNQGARIFYCADEDFDYVGEEKYRQIKAKGTGTVETRWQRKDGRIIDVLLSSTPLNLEDLSEGVTFTALDITQRTNAIKEIRESEKRYRMLFERSNDAIFIIDTQTGRYLGANRAALKLTGRSQEELQQLTASDITKEGAAEHIGIFSEASDTVEMGEVDYFRPDGSKRRALLSAIKLDDQISYGIAHDITERSLLEEKLQQAQKMEAVGTLAGGIAHDFNNILMGILGRTSLMMIDTDPYSSHSEHLSGIEEYVNSAKDLTRQLLGFARGGKYQLKTIDLKRLVEKSARMFGRTRKDINISFDFSDSLSLIEADYNQIEQVLLNLYVNAWQAMPDGGKLCLTIENVILDEMEVRAYELKSGGFVRLSIADTGSGMDDETVQKIFEPFFTTKTIGRGTGLGLASAYGIVKNHGGFITVQSKIGKGTTFDLYFPATEKPIIEEKEKIPVHAAQGSGVILLIDDEEMICKVGGQMLQRIGYTTLTAHTGEDALKIFSKKDQVFDLIILDMIMPGMNGGETYDRLKQIDPEIKILLSSGYSLNGQASDILSRGCDGFIQKPFTLKELSIAVRKILD